jgi:hypothetical protein
VYDLNKRGLIKSKWHALFMIPRIVLSYWANQGIKFWLGAEVLFYVYYLFNRRRLQAWTRTPLPSIEDRAKVSSKHTQPTTRTYSLMPRSSSPAACLRTTISGGCMNSKEQSKRVRWAAPTA